MSLVSCLTARESADTWKRFTGEKLSVSTLVRLCGEAGRCLEECSTEVMDELRKQEELPENASMVQVSLDGVMMRMIAQRLPLTFELASLATTLGVRHGLVILDAQQYHSGGCLVGGTSVKGGIVFERVLICYGPVGNISASSGLFILLDMAR